VVDRHGLDAQAEALVGAMAADLGAAATMATASP